MQHHSVVHMKERLLTSIRIRQAQEDPGSVFPPQDRYPKFGYLGYDPESQDSEHPEGEGQPGDGYGHEAYPATAPGGASDDDWVEDDDLAVQINVCTAVAAEAEVDELDDTYAESVQLAYAAQTAFAQAKGKSQGKGKLGGKPSGKVIRSNLTIADRKAKLAGP